MQKFCDCRAQSTINGYFSHFQSTTNDDQLTIRTTAIYHRVN